MTGQVCDRKRWVTDEGYRRDRKFHNTDCKTMQREPCFLCSLFHSKFIRQRSLSSSSTSLLFYLEGISIWTDSLSNMPEKNRRNDVHCIVLCPLAVGLAVGFPSLIPTPTLVFTTTSRARTLKITVLLRGSSTLVISVCNFFVALLLCRRSLCT